MFKRLPEFKKYCDNLQGVLALACWQGLAHPAYYYFAKEPKNVFSFCNTAPNKEAARECKLHSLSELVDVLTVDIKKASAICTLDESSDMVFDKDCNIELISLFLKPDLIYLQQAKEASSFCSSLHLSYQTDCYANIGKSLKYSGVSESVAKNFCTKAPKRFKASCIGKV